MECKGILEVVGLRRKNKRRRKKAMMLKIIVDEKTEAGLLHVAYHERHRR